MVWPKWFPMVDDMSRKRVHASYDMVAIGLHWCIAALIVAALILGELMPDTGGRGAPYALHASLGFAIMFLTVVRLIWRLTHAQPRYPALMPRWQIHATKAMTLALYALSMAVPLSGWLAHSAQASGRPFFINSDIFDLVAIPILSFDGLNVWTVLRTAFLNNVHELTSSLMIALIVLHVGAALKHHLIDRDDVLRRMLPSITRD